MSDSHRKGPGSLCRLSPSHHTVQNPTSVSTDAWDTWVSRGYPLPTSYQHISREYLTLVEGVSLQQLSAQRCRLSVLTDNIPPAPRPAQGQCSYGSGPSCQPSASIMATMPEVTIQGAHGPACCLILFIFPISLPLREICSIVFDFGSHTALSQASHLDRK